jgi:hypothetical protein
VPAIELEGGEVFPTVSFTGNFAFEDVPDIEHALDVLDLDPILILDLGHARSIDAAVIGALVRQQKSRQGRVVTVVREGQLVSRLLAIARVDTYLNVVGSREKALEHAAVLRDVNAAAFSRDGVSHPS